MKLYYTKASPFAACVRATIAELNAENLVELYESHPFNNDEEFLIVNPLGKVPCLLADGEPILDSEVICDYLDANISGGQLFEATYADWRLKTFYSIINGLMDSCVALQMESLRDKDGLKSEFWYQRNLSAIDRALIEIEKRLTTLPETITIIHITIICALGYLDFRHPTIDWRSERKELLAFFDRWKTRECFLSAVYS